MPDHRVAPVSQFALKMRPPCALNWTQIAVSVLQLVVFHMHEAYNLFARWDLHLCTGRKRRFSVARPVAA